MNGAPVPPTEDRNPRSAGLDRLPVRRILEVMNEEDRTVAAAVARALPAIERTVDLAVDSLGRGGRLFYLGAGTSGRLAVLDAAEIPPTFGLPSGLVVGVIAGGKEALVGAVEGAEDDALEAVARMRDFSVGPSDCVIGVTASGTTRFVLGGLGEARERGASAVLLTCGLAPSPGIWHALIALETGPEVLAGSTRLKAGTATKMVLNMISTAAMVRLGKAYDNLMVDVRASNAKLALRARRIVESIAGATPAAARAALEACGGEAKTAVVHLRLRLDPAAARALLESRGGRLRDALENP
ncbi:MAG: N-acetylmuramic acid 6-phosphate etherase [Planctomycetes bacterium]|nr:N-acetylmuramic acid 6-phosphate etherase [Planctomycetota bacterium]